MGAPEQTHFCVALSYKGPPIISTMRLELDSLLQADNPHTKLCLIIGKRLVNGQLSLLDRQSNILMAIHKPVINEYV